MTRGRLRVAACQTPEILGNVDAAMACIEHFAGQPDASDADVLLFPECFLQGYLVTPEHLERCAVELDSQTFASIQRRLGRIRPTLVLGLIERDQGRYFNSAAVLAQGELLGTYRKTHLMPGESLFDPGRTYPTFDLHGVRFGINICHDTQFPAAAAAVAAQEARLLLVPAQNMMRRQAATQWKDRHHQIRADRVRETGMWLVSADVTGERDEHYIGYGPTSIINPQAEIVAQVPLMTTGIVVADIT
jgi:predicted amidohydrolase